MILPVSVGIDGGMLAIVVAPLVDFALRKAWRLPVGNEPSILYLHEVGIVCHEIKVLGDCLK